MIQKETKAFRTLKDVLSLSEKLIALTESNPVAIRVSVSAKEIYDLVQEQLDLLLFLISEDHFRSQKKNPGIRVDLNKVDELGNTLHKVVVYPHRLTKMVDEEVAWIFLIKEILTKLYRHRSLNPSLLLTRLEVLSPHEKEKDPSSRKKKRRKRRGKFYA